MAQDATLSRWIARVRIPLAVLPVGFLFDLSAQVELVPGRPAPAGVAKLVRRTRLKSERAQAHVGSNPSLGMNTLRDSVIGNTAVSGTVFLGSNPSPAAKQGCITVPLCLC